MQIQNFRNQPRACLSRAVIMDDLRVIRQLEGVFDQLETHGLGANTPRWPMGLGRVAAALSRRGVSRESSGCP